MLFSCQLNLNNLQKNWQDSNPSTASYSGFLIAVKCSLQVEVRSLWYDEVDAIFEFAQRRKYSDLVSSLKALLLHENEHISTYLLIC